VSKEDAHIILVDTAGEEGQRTIEAWGREKTTTVLDARWVKLSIEAGRALLSADNFGNCAAKVQNYGSTSIGTGADSRSVHPSRITCCSVNTTP
jgi:hypothetical protein